MPSTWGQMDAGFPNFTGDESVKQQVRQIHDYLFKMREGLQYTLANLTAANFNQAAWEGMTQEQEALLQRYAQQFSNQLNGLRTELSAVGRELDAAEISLTFLEAELEEAAQRQTALETRVQTLEEAAAATQEVLEALQGAVKTEEDGSYTLGAEDRELRLLGSVYINGMLFEGGGTQ